MTVFGFDAVESVSWFAAVFTTAAFAPQAVKTLRTRDTRGISLAMYTMFSFGVAGWLTYGILVRSLPIVLANGLTLSLALLILSVKAKAVMDGEDRTPPGGELG